jgi:phospholipid/cholesterol/gamma-HCH transport system substrate-binding protein
MAFKVSNETKVGALTAVAITLLILGFNFLKGRSSSGKLYLYAKFQNVQGLVAANPITVNGYTVGTVEEVREGDQDLNSILVKMKLTKDIRVPNTAKALISSNPLGSTSVEIRFNDSSTIAVERSYFKTGDTIPSGVPTGLLDLVTNRLDPTLNEVKTTLRSIDTVLLSVNGVFDANTRGNLQGVIANANFATGHIVETTYELQKILNSQTGALAKTLNNASLFSQSIADSRERYANIIANLESTTQTLSRMELDRTIRKFNQAADSLQIAINRLNDKNGTVGALLNDRGVYNNLNASVNSLNLLLQDLRLHPKRYVNISVFGRKEKTAPIMKPLPTDTITGEQTFN